MFMFIDFEFFFIWLWTFHLHRLVLNALTEGKIGFNCKKQFLKILIENTKFWKKKIDERMEDIGPSMKLLFRSFLK